MDNQLQPTVLSERISSLDFLRGIAILGILFINIENFAYESPWSSWKCGYESAIDFNTRFWVYFLTQGKFYNMFAMLFGVGFVIFLERLEAKNIGLKAMDIYGRRLFWLFIIGVIHAYFIWDGDVLYHYSICGLLLIPFRSFKTKSIILVLLLLVSIITFKAYTTTVNSQKKQNDYLAALQIKESQRTEEQAKTISEWEKRFAVKSTKKVEKEEVENPKPTYFEGLKKSFEHAKVHEGELYYQSMLFPTLIIMLLGMMLYRTGIFVDYSVWKNYWLISILFLAIALIINYYRYYHWTFEDQKPVVSFWENLLYTFPRETLGVGYVLILNGIYQRFLKNIKLKIISNIGRTALSNYIFQSIIAGIIFYGYGFGQFNQFSRFELIPIVIIIWVIQILLTTVWLRFHKHGPLEWLWRKLTYSSFNN